MSDQAKLNSPLIPREQHDDANLAKWCRWVTFVLLLLSAPLDTFVIIIRGDWVAIKDQVAFQRQYYYSNLLFGVVFLIQIPLVIFCVPLVILTLCRGPSVAKRWAVNFLRRRECYIPPSSSI